MNGNVSALKGLFALD